METKDKIVVFASANKHKIQEVKNIMSGYTVISMSEVGFSGDIVEDGKTFEENALIKARAITKFLNDKGQNNYLVLSDDTGLCVDALGGEPGVYSARFAGDHNDQKNRDKIISLLFGKNDRSANFTCVVVLMDKNFDYIVGEGKTFGYMLDKEYGDTSFGYDAIFYSNDLKKSFGEATSAEKNSVSHRARAIKNLLSKC